MTVTIIHKKRPEPVPPPSANDNLTPGCPPEMQDTTPVQAEVNIVAPIAVVLEADTTAGASTVAPALEAGHPVHLAPPKRKPPTVLDRKQSLPVGQVTLVSDLLDRLKMLDTPEKIGQAKAEISALERLCKYANYADPGEVFASLAGVNILLDKLTPEVCGITHRSFGNMRSLVYRAVRRYLPNATHKRERRKPLYTPDWQVLVDGVPDWRNLIGLKRFIPFCIDHGIGPADVTNATVAQFSQWLRDTITRVKELLILKATIKAWNRAVLMVPGWPNFVLSLAAAVPLPSNRYTLDWATVPQSLQDDVDAYFTFRTTRQLRKAGRYTLLRPRTVQESRYHIRQIVSALVLSGVKLQDITSLSVLTQPDMADLAMNFFTARLGTDQATQTHQLSLTLKTIGKIWCKVSKEDQEELDNIHDNLSHRLIRLTPKNRATLDLINNRKTQLALYRLPDTIRAANTKIESTKLRAERERMAISIEILLHCPMRKENLANLDLTRHVFLKPTGSRGEGRITIPANETKNNRDLNYVLRNKLLERLRVYIEQHRPALTDEPSTYLFPARDGGPVSGGTIGFAIARATKQYLGILVNPHLFRHQAVHVSLMARPGDFEIPREILGHASSTTTRNHYADNQSLAASKVFQDTVLNVGKPSKPKGGR